MTLATANTIWQQVMTDLREMFDPKIVKTHLTKSEVVGVEEGKWTIGVISAYSAEELTKKVKGNILGFIEEHDGSVVDVEFVDKNNLQEKQLQAPINKIQGSSNKQVTNSRQEVTTPHETIAELSDSMDEKIDQRSAISDLRLTGKRETGRKPVSTHQLPLTEVNDDVYADTTISLDDLVTHKDVPRSSGVTVGQGSVYTNLNPHHVFENFVVGSSNRVAFAAAQAVAEGPGKAYNPLFIYGGVGVGKTHLMQAVGNAIVAKFPHLKVQYFTSERFTNDFIGSFKEKTTDAFRRQYRALDIMLIDDIQFIAGKESTQEEFFHTFNEIVGKGGHILMTSDKSPEEIGQLEERLVSRFKGGMLVDIGLPDYEMRVAIIKAKAEDMRVPIADDAVDFLAQHIQANTREMAGTLTSIVSKVRSQGWDFTLENVKSAWGEDMTSGPSLQSKQVSHSKVMQVVHHYFNIRKTDLTGKVRTRNFVIPRQICMYLMKEELGMAYEKIGFELGGRDHTTIMHGVEAIREELSTNEQLRKDMMLIKQTLLGQRAE